MANGGISGTVPDNSGGGIFVGSSPPGSSLTNKVWYKTDAAGRPLGVFMFYNGNWRKVYTGVGYGEIRMYIGTNTVFDGSGLGLVGGDFDGWQICNGLNGTPDLVGYFPAGGAWGTTVGQGAGWYTDADGVAFRSTGGQKQRVTLTNANLPPLQYEYFYQSVGAGAGPTALVADGSKPKAYEWVVDSVTHTVGGSQPLPFQHLYYAMAFIMFIGYA